MRNIKLTQTESHKQAIAYYLLAFIRVALTFIPQSGYIHPDEFFQSIEVVAGDIFDVESNRPWEFNATFPLRSIFIPSITVGLPFRLLRAIHPSVSYHLNISLRTPYWLIVFPRITMCLLSFIVDYCLYKICKINNEKTFKYREKLLIIASSYVLIIYGTHTFSNTIEMILLSILLYFVADSQIYSHAIIQQNEFLTQRYERANAIVDRVRLFKMRSSLPQHTMRNCVLISFVTVVGFFNRPTFIAFAFPPVFFWVHRGIGFRTVRFAEFHYRMFLFLCCTVLFTAFFIIIDSLYFGYISIPELQQMDISMDNFVVTPLNFIKYNMDTTKLMGHGLHPRFLHLLINIPLLYNVLGVIGIGCVGLLIYRLVSGQFAKLPKLHSINGLMIASIITPVATLSYFPHQEPRFLIPITLPLVYLYAGILTRRKSLIRAWATVNLVCVLFYGFVHQAGVFPLTVHLSRQVQPNQHVHLVTSHIYTVPISLLMHRNSRAVYGTGASKYIIPKRLVLYEMGSNNPATLLKRLTVIQHVQSLSNNSTHVDNSAHLLYLVLPVTKQYELDAVLKERYTHFKLETIQTFYPHLSTEALPNIGHYSIALSISSVIDFVTDLSKSCGLRLYQVHYNNTITVYNNNINGSEV